MDNLTRPERKAMSSLRTRNDIIVKRADKGSATVVMSKEDYMTKVMQHLNNEQHYRELNEDPTDQYTQEITTSLTDMVNHQVIIKHRDFMCSQDPQTRKSRKTNSIVMWIAN